MKTNKDIELEVMRVHNLFWESYARRDIGLRFSLCSEDVTFIGSGLHERALNKTEYKNINKEGVKQFPDPFQIEFLWTNLTMLNENVACIESEVVWSQLINDEMFKELLRNTTLLKREYNKWLVTHVHGSVPDYRLKDGDYMTNEQTIIRNRELERQVFERTQDLNKTLEELEQKNRELEIEASLEKVRSSALAMKEPADMVNVCNVISDQLQLLGVNDIRNVQTAIINEQKVTYLNYQYFAAYKEGVIEETDFNKHPTVLAMVEEMKKSANSSFSGSMKNIELNTFREWRKQNNQFPDPILDEVDSAHYYFYSIGLGGLGLTTYKPLPEEGLDIFKRFHNVFTLAYRRFIDIEKAIAQAREAKIEASLERVRSKAMAMHSPNDLSDTVNVFFKELKTLGIIPIRCGVGQIDEATRTTSLTTTTSSQQGESLQVIGKVKQTGHPVLDGIFDHWKLQKEYHPVLKGKDIKAYYGVMNAQIGYPEYPEGVTQYGNNFFFKEGFVFAWTENLLSEEELVIFRRFTSVLSLTYRRYKDLKEAEAQAREAKIEASMEKIRSRSLAMQKPEELVEVAELLRKEMGHLGVEELETSSIYIVDKENHQAECWYAIKDIREENKRLVSDEMTITLSDTWVGNEMWKFYRSKKEQTFIVMKGDNRKEWINYCADHSKVLKGYYGDVIPERTYHLVKFSNGFMGAASPGDISLESWDLLKRAAAVFSLAYTRFKDLQDAEARTKEAQIELALERVRARTMGMQKSEELKDVIRVVYEQFVHLKINVDHAGFVVDYTPKGDWHFWIADEQDIPSKITHPYFESVWANQFNEAKEKGADFFATILNFEEKNKFYNELLSYVPGLPEASKDFYLSCPGLAATTVLFDNVSLYIENFSGTPYSDEENKTLMRFGKVFQQTYTRFLDLQKAEAQNKIIQAENERKTKELEEARQLQLAMLPKSVPEIPNLDIAVYMKTATEVGGDYYDFKVQENGVLNIGIGDATGHGLQAGTMITLMKGFFTSDAAKFNPQKFLEHCNGMIRDIKLGRILMSFSHLRFENSRLLISSAGMPPIYYHHKKNHRTEEIIIQGLPLGAMRNASYKLVEKEINSGDTILLLTDGLPEQMNEHKVIFDYSRVLKYFDEIAENAPKDIISRLVQKTDEWMDGQKQSDDITFVVIKVK